ncbi:MAG: DUF11 domain-containing protein [Gammaproteobacteria bacterium]|nr:DUF11 domain-containing protein [Gammaproteobacteria bacterium]
MHRIRTTGTDSSMKMARTTIARLLWIGLFAAMPAAANVEMTTTVQKVILQEDAKGNSVRKLVSADQVVPGDTLHYVISFSNKGSSSVDSGSIVITNPLPPDTVYLEGTAAGSGTEVSYSVDSGGMFGRPEELTVLREGERVPAQAADYTTIRWAFKPALEAGKTGDVSFSVRLK